MEIKATATKPMDEHFPPPHPQQLLSSPARHRHHHHQEESANPATRTRMGSVTSEDHHFEDYRPEQIYYQADLNEPRIPNVYEPFKKEEPYSPRSSSPCPDTQMSHTGGEDGCEPPPTRHHTDLTMPFNQRDLLGDGKRWTTAGSAHASSRYFESRDFSNRGDKSTARRRPKGDVHYSPRREVDRTRQAKRQSSLEDWMDAGDKLFAPRRR